MHPVLVIEEGKRNIPNQHSPLVDEVRIIELLIRHHHLLHDLQGIYPAIHLLQLNLDGVQAHSRLVVNQGSGLLNVELRLIVLVQDVSLLVQLPNSREKIGDGIGNVY